MKLNVFILKSFRDASRHDEFAIAVAHELSHVVLESIQHPLRHEEKAVDLTAMLLGFSDLYRKTAHTVRWLDDKQFERRQLGYLSPTELEEACRILLPTRMRARHVVSKRAEANGGRLFLLGSCAAIALAILASNEWDKYQLASTEAANIASEVPRKLNPFTTLVSVHAGLASVTRQFVVTIPKYRIGDLAAFQSRLRTTACAREGRNIERGLSYVYDYRNPEGEQIAHFKVSSCP